MLGTFWVWYRSSVLDNNGIPMYSNIVKCEILSKNSKVGSTDTATIVISEKQLLTKTSIQKADAGINEAFIPSINDYIDIFYANGLKDTDNPNTWINKFSGRVVLQPYLSRIDSACYEIQLVGNELLSNNKVIGSVLSDGVSFKDKNTKDIITLILEAQRDATLKNAQYKVIFDKDIQNKLQKEKGGVRATANNKVETVLQDILQANQLQLFISKQNVGESQTVKYHITDKFYNPDYIKPFFKLDNNTCQVLPKIRTQPTKQANRFFYNAGNQSLLDIDGQTFQNNSQIYYGDTFYNLSGIAGNINEEKIDNSFIPQETFTLIKASRKSKNQNSIVAKEVKKIANKLGFNKIKNDLIAQSVMQIKLAVDGFEIPKDYLTTDGKNFWNKQPTVIDKGMRFILELPNFNYSQEMLITEVVVDLREGSFEVMLDIIPVQILEAKESFFTLPNLLAKYKAENNQKTPNALEMIQYIFKNPTEPEAKFQLGLLYPLQYGSNTTNTKIINQTRILTIADE